MDTNTHTELFQYPGYLDPGIQLKLAKSKTTCGVDIIHLEGMYDPLYDQLPNKSNSFNIIDFQAISEFDMAHYTRCALKHLPKKENIVIGYLTEAINSTYWNVVFDILQEDGYKNIMWIDGGLTPGSMFRHLHHLKITHFRSPMFFQTLFRPMVVEKMPHAGEIGNRKIHYLSLGRLVRQERIYFTKKLLDNPTLFNKGIVTCGWGDGTLHIWENYHSLDYLKTILEDEDIKKFPLTLGHGDFDQHHFMDEFKEAIFNIVQESSVGTDFRSHATIYNVIPPTWQTVSSDRIFFTEKTAKAFLMNQIPLIIAAPGMVEVLRDLGFDMFDDIVDHSYDKEDNIFKRCDMVYNELERLVSMYTTHGWVKFIEKKHLTHRFFHNYENVKKLSHTEYLTNWVQENF